MNIATVVEGPTDRLVLEALIDAVLPGPHRFFKLQPLEPPERINGWKGVRDWCREYRDVATLMSGEYGPPVDMLVIQVDADIATEENLQAGNETLAENVAMPCPPIEDTIRWLEIVILGWMGRRELPPKVILAIPSQDLENWTFAALFPEDESCGKPDYECIRKGHDRPAYRLTTKAYGGVLTSKGGTVRKTARAYQGMTPAIVKNWNQVRRICSQAERFDADLRSFMTR